MIFDFATASDSATLYNLRAGTEVKSPSTAFATSAAGTAVPILAGGLAAMNGHHEAAVVLISAGIIVGPSLGHWYAGRARRGLATTALRTGIAVVAVIVGIDLE